MGGKTTFLHTFNTDQIAISFFYTDYVNQLFGFLLPTSCYRNESSLQNIESLKKKIGTTHYAEHEHLTSGKSFFTTTL